MREIVAANNRMLDQQKLDKEAVVEKQKANQEAINVLAANRQKLEDDEQVLKVRQAELQVAQLNLAAEKATAEDEKNDLIAQKAAAEEAARQAAARQAEYEAQQAALAQQQAASAVAQVVATVSTPKATTETKTEEPTAPAVSSTAAASNAKYDASSYPIGECTWGVKSQVSWVGPYWGNANQWVASARAEGFSVGTTPQVGAVAVWVGGAYGHVALVTAVESSTNIQVSESNYNGHRYIGNHRGWFNPTTTSEGAVYYIYP